MATEKTLLPAPYLTLEDLDGDPITGGTVTFLDTGTAVLAVVYADANGLVVSANPLTVDAAGRYTVFLTPGQVVDVEYRDPFGTLIKTVPGVQAVPSASGNVDVSGIVGNGPAAAGTLYYLSSTDGRWYLADATGTVYQQTLGVAVAATGAPGSTAIFRTAGRLEGYSGLVVGAYYYMSLTPGALSLTLDVVVGRLVGQADTTTSLVLWPNPAAIDAPQIGALVVSGVLPQLVVTHPTMAFRNTAKLTVHGIKAGYHGQRVRLMQYDGVQVDLVHESPSAITTDRLYNITTSGPTSLAGTGTGAPVGGRGSAEYEYDRGFQRWRLIAHEQGGWLAPAFNAADYTASGGGGGTWVVSAGAVNYFRYVLRGNALTLSLYLGATSITGSPNQLVVRLPGGFTVGPTWSGATRVAQIYDASGMQECLVGGGGSSLSIQKNSNAVWAAGVSPVVLLSLTLEVQ